MCDKKSFVSYESAIQSARHIRKMQHFGSQNQKRIPKRAYKCPECGMFHLTSCKGKSKRTHGVRSLFFDYNGAMDKRLWEIYNKSNIKINRA